MNKNASCQSTAGITVRGKSGSRMAGFWLPRPQRPATWPGTPGQGASLTAGPSPHEATVLPGAPCTREPAPVPWSWLSPQGRPGLIPPRGEVPLRVGLLRIRDPSCTGALSQQISLRWFRKRRSTSVFGTPTPSPAVRGHEEGPDSPAT